MRSRRWFAGLGVLLLAGLLPGHGQTFDVNGGQKSPSPGLGWGSNIEVTREARAAQTDLARLSATVEETWDELIAQAPSVAYRERVRDLRKQADTVGAVLLRRITRADHTAFR